MCLNPQHPSRELHREVPAFQAGTSKVLVLLLLLLLLLLCHAQGTPPNSAMGWTGELWSKTKFLILEN